jgi:hypothetical protein
MGHVGLEMEMRATVTSGAGREAMGTLAEARAARGMTSSEQASVRGWSSALARVGKTQGIAS